MLSFIRFRVFLAFLFCLLPGITTAELAETIQRIKPSILVIGTYKKTGSPQFAMRGTGFVVREGNLIATNAHVVTDITDPEMELVVRIGQGRSQSESRLRPAKVIAVSKTHDLAVLRIEGEPFPALKLANSDSVREGQTIAFTGFPIGGALGFSPVTHRGIVSSITPIALPAGNASQINDKLIRQLKSGTFNIFQLDATAYPGNSGSPVFDVTSGEVIGVINMVFIKGTKEAALSQPSGIAYAIPAKYLIELIDQQYQASR